MEMYSFTFYISKDDKGLKGENFKGESIEDCFTQFRTKYPLGYILHVINKTDI